MGLTLLCRRAIDAAASPGSVAMAGLALATLCALPTLFAPGPLATAAAGVGAIAALVAAAVERRLFFAEARRVPISRYGTPTTGTASKVGIDI